MAGTGVLVAVGSGVLVAVGSGVLVAVGSDVLVAVGSGVLVGGSGVGVGSSTVTKTGSDVARTVLLSTNWAVSVYSPELAKPTVVRQLPSALATAAPTTRLLTVTRTLAPPSAVPSRRKV